MAPDRGGPGASWQAGWSAPAGERDAADPGRGTFSKHCPMWSVIHTGMAQRLTPCSSYCCRFAGNRLDWSGAFFRSLYRAFTGVCGASDARAARRWPDEGRCDPDRVGRHHAAPRGGYRPAAAMAPDGRILPAAPWLSRRRTGRFLAPLAYIKLRHNRSSSRRSRLDLGAVPHSGRPSCVPSMVKYQAKTGT
jgi:hypothetical protein